VALHVELLMPDRSLWSGEAGMVIAKTIDGDVGVLAGHSPIFGILSPGSLVRIQPLAGHQEEGGEAGSGAEVRAAVRDGFLSVTDDRVSILASSGTLGSDVDSSEAQTNLDNAAAEAGSSSAAEESVDVRYARAQLRAAGQQA
jgi:F-type H+-transporting ATPase subunit epsilon